MPASTPVIVIPRITIAISVSASVTPCSDRDRTNLNSDLDLVEDPVHGRHESDGDEAHDQPHEDDDGGLEQAGEPGQLVIELALEVGGGGLQLLVERARVLADADHLPS